MKFTLCYRLICGHEETKSLKDNRYKVMFKDGCYHVKVFSFKNYERLTRECFDTFTAANKFFKSIK